MSTMLSGGVPRILVVDDRAENRLAYRSTLSGDYEVVMVDSGREAIRYLLEGEVALILLDVVMPNMSGFETASLIRARPKTSAVPIVFITAYGADEIQAFNGYAVGAADFITTPINPEILKAKVAAFVNLYRYNKAKEALLEHEISVARERKEHERHLAEAGQRAALLKQRQEYEKRTAQMLLQKYQEFEQFAFIASHDLKSPLRTISGYLTLLDRKYQGNLDAEGKKYLHFVLSNAKRLTHLIDDLLNYSKIGTTNREVKPVSLNDILDETCRNLTSLIEETQAKIEMGELPVIVADRSQMLQVFQNLISNSLIHRSQRAPLIRIHSRPVGDEWEIAVVDNGQGFEMKHAQEIFKMFRSLQRNEQGTGIGLAICRRIIERHHGTIWAESTLGQGSTFFIRLPSGKAESIDLHGMKVLVVDDAVEVRELTKKILDESRINCDCVETGRLALHRLKDRSYDVILLDIMMPEMDGWETLHHIREQGCATPVVAFSTIGDRTEFMKRGFNDYLAKEELDSRVVHFLRRFEPTLDRVRPIPGVSD